MTTALLIHGGASTARFWDRVVERVGPGGGRRRPARDGGTGRRT